MRVNTAKAPRFLATLFALLLVLGASLPVPLSLSASGIHSAILGAVEPGEGAQFGGEGFVAAPLARESRLHRGHLGFDKHTGQPLGSSSVSTPMPDSPLSGQGRERYFATKLQGVDPTRITFRSGHTIHPEPGIDPAVLEMLSSAADGAAGGRYYLIQFNYPFPTEVRLRLEDAGVKFYDYVDVAGFLAHVPPTGVGELRSLVSEGLVRHVGQIPVEAKLSPELAVPTVQSPSAQREVVVLTYEEPTHSQLAELERWLTIDRRSDGPLHILEGRLAASAIQALAGLGFVRWIEPQRVPIPGNLDGGMGIGADLVRAEGDTGIGVQVMVVDTGIARSGSTYHPDLQSDRILDQYDYQDGDNDASEDVDYPHGTHVAGSIGGRYNTGNPNSQRSWQGVAPGVDFLIYRLCCGDGQFSDVWFQQSLQRATTRVRPAYISNNSWGLLSAFGEYTVLSEIADRAVRGEYGSQPLNMVLISHNQNDLTTPPGTAKNAITVGAVKDGNYPLWDISVPACGSPDENWPPGERLCYSNHGPIDSDGDGGTRVKPDLVAPGAMIASAVPWYLYDGQYYQYLDGTSMAAPHVTGAIAQILDAYSEVADWLVDWPEVVKAILLATAVDVGGNPDHYGRGLIDPYHAIYWQPGINEALDFWADNASGSGWSKDFTFSVPSGYEEVRVVLTWPDPAGSTEVTNDLDILRVTDGSGAERGGSLSGDDTVEYVRIPSGYASGTWTVTVWAYSLGEPAQSFGLAAQTILAAPNLGMHTQVQYIPSSAHSADPGEAFYLHQYVSNLGYTAGGSYVQLNVPDGFTVLGVRVYTLEGHTHWYDASELPHDASTPSVWRVAVGETIAGHDRHVRWHLQVDADAACGPHVFSGDAFWRQGGQTYGTETPGTTISVTCSSYLPLVLRNH